MIVFIDFFQVIIYKSKKLSKNRSNYKQRYLKNNIYFKFQLNEINLSDWEKALRKRPSAAKDCQPLKFHFIVIG